MPDAPHKPEAVLVKELAEAAKQITVGAIYRHYKQQNYTVLELAVNEADSQLYVVYQMNYGARLICLRPVKSWLETVEVDGRTIPRFKKI